MDFNFGSVSAGEINSRTVRMSQNLVCSNATTVTLRLTSPLTLSPTLSSSLSVNGETLRNDNDGVDITPGPNDTSLEFVASLTGNKVAAGAYSASSVLIMDFR